MSRLVLFGWGAWLAFNWLVFMTTRTPETFDRTAQLAPAFLRSLRAKTDDNDSPQAEPASLDAGVIRRARLDVNCCNLAEEQIASSRGHPQHRYCQLPNAYPNWSS